MEEKTQEFDGELAFLNAMRAYRRAKESGDERLIREAEEAWRAQVRQEMIENESCAT